MNIKLTLLFLLCLGINCNSVRLDNSQVIKSLNKQPRNIILNYDISFNDSLTLTNLSLDFDGDFLVVVDRNFLPVIIKKNDLANYQIMAQNSTVTPLYLSNPEALLLGNVNLKKHTAKQNLVGAPVGQSIYLLPTSVQKADVNQKSVQQKTIRSKKRNRKNGQ
jgi:hypothetical protein